MIATRYAHVELTPEGTPIIAGTTMKVVELAAEHVAWAWEAEQLRRQHPYLTLGQIHSALAYYYDHQTDLDRVIAERERVADDVAARHEETMRRLRSSLLEQRP